MTDELGFEGKLLGRSLKLCTVPGILSQLPSEEHRIAVVKALSADPDDVPTSRIERALRGQNVPSSRPKLDEHRRGDCGCPKT